MFLEVQNTSRRFGKKVALDGVSFSARPGEIIAVLGDNGAGKSTLLQMISGLVVPTSGEVLIDGEKCTRRDESFRRRMAVVPDFPQAFADHTVLQHLAMVCRLYAVASDGLEQRAVALMEEIGILELGQTRMAALSRGELYKAVAVGFLLVHPELWLLDEPMASGMDPRGLTAFRHHLYEQCAAGATVLYTTQIPEIAEKFSDRVLVLQSGSLVAAEPATALASRLGAPSLTQALEMLAAETRP